MEQSKGRSPFIDSLRNAIRVRHYSIRTEQSYVGWVKHFIFFHGKRHPKDMGEQEVGAFLTHLAVNKNVAASTQNQALNALVFLYKAVLNRPLGDINGVVRAKKPQRLPVVLSCEEVRQVLDHIQGVHWLIACLLYGSGLRLMEAVRLRVQDLDFNQCAIYVRNGKGGKDRMVTLASELIVPIQRHLETVRTLHERDLSQGYGEVYLPYALARKYPNAPSVWGWQYVFPSKNLSKDPRSGVTRRHHLDESCVQRAVKIAVRKAGIQRRVTCHTLRHSLPLTCWSGAWIYAQYRSSWVIRISVLHRFIPM